jgi:hypothetical protein
MSYIVPSVLVYQQLASNAGVANITPDLDACIIGPAYNVVPYIAGLASSLIATAAKTSLGATATLTNNTVINTVYLGSQATGQVVDPNTVKVYFNSAAVETKVCYMTGTSGANVLSFVTYSGTGATTSGLATVTAVTNIAQLNVGDKMTITGAGAGGSILSSTIVGISGTTLTLADAAGTSVSTATMARTSFDNLNSATSTLRVESGDTVVITYSSTVVTSTVMATVGTGNLVTSLTISDLLPNGVASAFNVSFRKAFNNLLLPLSYNGHTNYSVSNIGVDGSVSINPLPVVTYGTVLSATIHLPYIALRTDLSGSLLEYSSVAEQVGELGAATDDNPLALGVNLALANTTGRILAVAVPSNDLTGYLSALSLIESSRVYAITPLTQDISIIAAVNAHVQQMSTPENAAWRISLVNTAIPTVKYIGQYLPTLVNANSGNNSVALVSGSYVLTSSNSTFIADGVVPGDLIKVASHNTTSQVVTSMTVLQVLNNQQVKVDAPIALTAVNFYTQRNLSKSQQAQAIADMSASMLSSRVLHVQPDSVGVNVGGVVKYLPGYYLCCTMVGLISGLPAQQSLTNIGVAGISDLRHSNRYFTRAQLSTIAGNGTTLLAQEAAGTIPYIRHSITTDMSVLQYRELQQVKNIDFLSYFFHDILKAFPGRYNITPDTLQILRTTLVAGAKLLQGKRLPKIGAPLLDYQIKTLKQDDVNKDTIIVEMPVTMPTVANYINLYLIY